MQELLFSTAGPADCARIGAAAFLVEYGNRAVIAWRNQTERSGVAYVLGNSGEGGGSRRGQPGHR